MVLAEAMIEVYEHEARFLDIKLRNGAVLIPCEILKQKLCLHKGDLMDSFGKIKEARDLYLDSINTGNKFDIRVRE